MESRSVKNKVFFRLVVIFSFASFAFGQEKKNNLKAAEVDALKSKKQSDSFAEAMKAIEAVRQKDAAKEISRLDKELSVRKLQKELRESVRGAAARLGDGAVEEIDSKISSAKTFAKGFLEKEVKKIDNPVEVGIGKENKNKKSDDSNPDDLPSPPGLEDGEVQKGVENPRSTITPERVREVNESTAETVIDADGRVIFDGSGSLGEGYQVVIFEDNVILTSPGFTMLSDRLEARFKRKKKSNPVNVDIGSAPKGGGGRLELAEATGREVVVTRKLSKEELQVAKAGKVTYKAKDPNDKDSVDEVILEIYPSVQRGENRVIAKSIGTRITLRGDEMIVEGPVRTQLVGRGGLSAPGEGKGVRSEGGLRGAVKRTVIDAEKGAVFNRIKSGTKTRELFFEGNVSVADPGFDLFCEKLTAYMRPFSKQGLMDKAVALGTEKKRVQVQRRDTDGEVLLGRAGMVTYIGESGDVVLDNWPEIRRNKHSSVAMHRDAQIVLKGDGNVVSRGVGTKIIREKKTIGSGDNGG